jgi:hypothetical protein
MSMDSAREVQTPRSLAGDQHIPCEFVIVVRNWTMSMTEYAARESLGLCMSWRRIVCSLSRGLPLYATCQRQRVDGTSAT